MTSFFKDFVFIAALCFVLAGFKQNVIATFSALQVY